MDVKTQNVKEIVIVMMETTMPDAPLMAVTAVVIISILNTAKSANVSKEQQRQPPPQLKHQQVDVKTQNGKEIVIVMTETTMLDAPSMGVTAVVMMSILNTVKSANVSKEQQQQPPQRKHQQAGVNFLSIKEMVTVMMETTMQDVPLMKEIVVVMMLSPTFAMFVNASNKSVIN